MDATRTYPPTALLSQPIPLPTPTLHLSNSPLLKISQGPPPRPASCPLFPHAPPPARRLPPPPPPPPLNSPSPPSPHLPP